MMHALLSTALIAAVTHVAPVPRTIVADASTRGALDTALAAPAAKRLTLDLASGGTVKITGSQDKVVHIRVTENGKPCGDCGVQLEDGSEGVKVHSARPAAGGTLRFEIEVPEHFDVQLASAGGEVQIEGVDGAIRGETASGALDLLRISGSVDLVTKRGDVTLRQSYVRGRVHTNDGRVLLEDVGGNVAGSSQDGKVIERRVERTGA
jgi:hypothetical protein